MKILIAVHHFPPRYSGGAEGEAKRHAASLLARGHEVRVVCVEHIDQGPPDDLAWTDETYEGIPVRRLSFDLGRVPDRFRWEYDNPWVGRHFRDLFAEDRPDVFLLIGGYLLTASPLVAAHEAGVPSIVRLVDFWYLCPRITLMRSDGRLSRLPIDPATCARCLGEEKRRYRLPARFLPSIMQVFWGLQRGRVRQVRTRLDFLRQVLAGVDAGLCPSQFLRRIYVSAGADPTRLHFLRQGIAQPASMSEPEPPPPLRLGYLGQIAHLKGVDVLVRALRALPDEPIELNIYGDTRFFPGYVDQLRTLAAGDERIRLCGLYQEHGGITAALRDLHALVVPSIWYENSPNTILEAFAHGLPVIASDLGGMAELVRHEEAGLLFRPGDAQSLAHQIRRLLREPSLLPVLRSGVPPVKSSAEEIDEFEGWCRRLLGRSPVAGRERSA